MKTTVRQLGTVAPKHVAARVSELAAQYHLRNIGFEHVEPGKGIYLGEDTTYDFYMPDGERRNLRMAGEWNMTATSTQGPSSRIGNSMVMPQGSWAVQFEIFCGHPMIHVYHWGVPTLAGGSNVRA